MNNFFQLHCVYKQHFICCIFYLWMEYDIKICLCTHDINVFTIVFVGWVMRIQTRKTKVWNKDKKCLYMWIVTIAQGIKQRKIQVYNQCMYKYSWRRSSFTWWMWLKTRRRFYMYTRDCFVITIRVANGVHKIHWYSISKGKKN